MAKLLVTGASGFLGWNLCQLAAPDWEVYGVCRSHPLAIPKVKSVRADLTDFQAVQPLLQSVKPDAVIHLAAESSPNRCQQQPELSHRINVDASVNLARLCADARIPYVFASSEQVFDGLNPPYKETDSVSPINLYGEQKALAEEKILDCYSSAAVCRLPLMFGAAPPGASSFLQPFMQTLQEGRSLQLFVDEFRTPASSTTVAKGLLLALEKVQGILHLGGRDRISRYDFGQLMVEVFDLPVEGLTASRQGDVAMAAPRPPDVSLDNSKAFALGYAPASLREELAALRGLVE